MLKKNWKNLKEKHKGGFKMKKKEIKYVSTFSKMINLIGFIGVLTAILVSSFSLSLKIFLTSIFLLLWAAGLSYNIKKK